MTAAAKTRPMSLLAEVTFRCPLKCPYCSNPLHMNRYREELDTETWLRVLREAAELGVIQVHFSGGEPLVRRDLVELVREARVLDLYSDLSTGATVATPQKWDALKEAGLDAVQVSVLDSRAESNDRLAGAPSFTAKREAVAYAKSLGFPITLNVVLHRQNLDRLQEIIAMAREWDVEKIELAHVQYTGWAYLNRAALLPTRAQLDRALEIVEAAETEYEGEMRILHVLPDYYQQYPKPCLNGWGTTFLTVAPDGAALPCQTAREIPGLEFPNVRDAPLDEIWWNSPIFNRFRGTDWLPEPCRSCERKEIDFGGCRCQAFLLGGDAALPDPVCHKSPMRHLIDAALEDANRPAPEFEYRVMRG